MCGIAGIIVWTPKDWAATRSAERVIPESWLDLLDGAIAHRGPDGAGRWRARTVDAGHGKTADIALVHRRLSIIDIAGGEQPMVSERGPAGSAQSGARSGTVATVFNGCIYNHRELRRELAGLGHVFVSDHSDTEVLLHGWRQWRNDLWEKLEGMYAAAIWDAGAGSLTLARDRFGEKPLYWCEIAGGPQGQAHARGEERSRSVAFASSAAALEPFARPGSCADSDGSRLRDWVRFGCAQHAPDARVRQLRTAQAMTLRSRGVLLTETWFSGGERGASVALLSGEEPGDGDSGGGAYDPAEKTVVSRGFPMRIERLDVTGAERLLVNAVESRLEADVPLGCFLSGGVDSTLIAAIARRKLGRLRTFTVRMPDAAYDESGFAERVAGVIGSDHETLACDAKPADDVVALIEQMGLPLGDSSLLPTYWVSRAARGRVKVALSGDGGDELFCGYERYAAAKRLSGVTRLLARMCPSGFLARRDAKSWTTKLARFIDASKGDGYVDLVSIFPSKMLNKLVDEAVPDDGWAAWLGGTSGAMVWDVTRYLPNDLLRKSDSASMACALEVRAPMLDWGLASAAMATRLTDLCSGGRLKGLLKDVAARYVPAEIVNRPKMGFAIPIGAWFREDFGGLGTLLRDALTPEALSGLPLNAAFIARIMDEHMSGRIDHSQRLYLLMVTSIWNRWRKGVAKPELAEWQRE